MTAASQWVKCPAGHVNLASNVECRSCLKPSGVAGTVLAAVNKYRAPQDFRWRDKAACREMPPDMFQPTNEVDARKAKRVCRTPCPVFAQCRIEAKAQGRWIVGVWAGEWFPDPSVKSDNK